MLMIPKNDTALLRELREGDRMRRCKSCTAPICFGAGLIVAAILPPKAVCVTAAIVIIITCLKFRR